MTARFPGHDLECHMVCTIVWAVVRIDARNPLRKVTLAMPRSVNSRVLRAMIVLASPPVLAPLSLVRPAQAQIGIGLRVTFAPPSLPVYVQPPPPTRSRPARPAPRPVTLAAAHLAAGQEGMHR